MAEAFDTPTYIRGPLRTPRQMLAEQEYGGHLSIHDDSTAEKMGFQAGGPIEGPTHFSQFVPLLYDLWGQEWFETGCLSAHYRNMVVEGEKVRALVEQPRGGHTQVRIRAEKEDGTEVLIGTASIRGDIGSSEIATRMARLRPPGPLVVLRDLEVGMKGKGLEEVRMDFDQHMGSLYPFSLNQKLDKITEPSPWYTADEGASSPWGRAIIPLEMVSVLAGYSNRKAGFPTRGPALGLFAGQQIRMINGPLFVGQDYLLEREIVALSESRRTESNWVRTTFLDAESKEPRAEMILNNATLKHSFEGYEKERAEYEKERAAMA
ncbi:MAG: hypothetical protein OYL92_02570 [Acidobacteriota bacterium]|nr:hypothetical protein [Acidobacteriota bacterium]MDE3263828.1 hypothetical protein [Acidobacteriota bacterium]